MRPPESCDFDEKERVAVGGLMKGPDEVGLAGFIRLQKEGRDVSFGETLERQSLPLLSGASELSPRRCARQLSLPKRSHDEQRELSRGRGEKLEQQHRGDVGYVQVLEDDEEREALRCIRKDGAYGVHQSESSLVGAEVCGVAIDRG